MDIRVWINRCPYIIADKSGTAPTEQQCNVEKTMRFCVNDIVLQQ